MASLLLALCREREFTLVWPQNRWSLLLDEQTRFAAAGVRLLSLIHIWVR